MLKTKIKFTYEPLPDIFNEISANMPKNISELFLNASIKMRKMPATEAWNSSINMTTLNLTREDINIVRDLGKLLR